MDNKEKEAYFFIKKLKQELSDLGIPISSITIFTEDRKRLLIFRNEFYTQIPFMIYENCREDCFSLSKNEIKALLGEKTQMFLIVN
ncbi:MAG: hypothetical protein H6627_10755 [Calditrichae bacterium]|nr:hypothetical protein [Calditrichia bacterium]